MDRCRVCNRERHLLSCLGRILVKMPIMECVMPLKTSTGTVVSALSHIFLGGTSDERPLLYKYNIDVYCRRDEREVLYDMNPRERE